MVTAPADALDAAASRVRELAASYEPPDFAEVPGPDAALFLCAIDHKSGFRARHLVGGEGPYEGSALLWALGLAAERSRPGTLSAAGLRDASEGRVAEIFRIEAEVVAWPGERARLWRNLAAGLERDHRGSAAALIDGAGDRLAGPGGLLARLAEFEAYSDPLQKKSFLFAKIAARRGWLEVSDPDSWQVCADNVLMRLALRAGLVREGPVEEVREATRAVFAAVADEAGISPPVLDDLLWELGRDDPDLLGAAAGDLREPDRPAGQSWY
ncbi:MAG: hypothetical protein ACXWEA_07895 [Solirubrobacterales bacterium]